MVLRYAALLSSHLARPKAALITLAALGSAAGIAEAAVLVLLADAVSIVAGGGDSNGVSGLTAVFGSPEAALGVAACLSLTLIVVHIVAARMTARLSSAVLVRLRDDALTAYFGAGWEHISTLPRTAFQETVSSLSLQSARLMQTLASGLTASFNVLALLLASLLVDPIVAVVVLALGLVLFALFRPVGRLTRRRGTDFVGANSRFNETTGSLAGMAMEIRSFDTQREVITRLSHLNGEAGEGFRRARFAQRAGADLFRDFAILLMVVGVGALVLSDANGVASLAAVILLLLRSLLYGASIQSTIQVLNLEGPNLVSLRQRIDSLSDGADPSGDRSLVDFATLEFDHVGYSYPNGQVALDGIAFDVAAGDSVAIVGPSGGGKSTLAQVLLRLRYPSAGTIRVNGIPYEDLDNVAWSRLVSVVPQEPQLVEGTIADNIRFFRRHVTDEDIQRCARLAGIDTQIRSFEQGYDTHVVGGGLGLSGGQKQRIAVARALVGSPSLLVLDEPSSALDGASEALLQETIAGLRGRVTLVVITHRLENVHDVDKVVEIADARIARITENDAQPTTQRGFAPPPPPFAPPTGAPFDPRVTS